MLYIYTHFTHIVALLNVFIQRCGVYKEGLWYLLIKTVKISTNTKFSELNANKKFIVLSAAIECVKVGTKSVTNS